MLATVVSVLPARKVSRGHILIGISSVFSCLANPGPVWAQLLVLRAAVSKNVAVRGYLMPSLESYLSMSESVILVIIDCKEINNKERHLYHFFHSRYVKPSSF